MNTLVGSTVRLEPLTAHHIPALFTELGNDVEAWSWMLVVTPSSEAEIATIVNRYLAEFAAGTREPFAVIHLESGRTIGTTSFMDICAKDRTVEIGSTIYAREFWRTRVNTETKFLLLAEAFEVQGFNRVALKTDNENKRSQAAIERIGAKFEGALRSHKIRPDGTLRDSMYYSILKREWPQVKANLQRVLG
jgi:RimJ/RimL family protein N-acetyltransferase